MNNKFIRARRFIRPFLKYASLIVLIWLIAIFIMLSGAYRQLKQAAVAGLAGKTELTAAAAAAKDQNWPLSLNKAETARQQFTAALENLDQTRNNSAVKKIRLVRRQINDLEYLLKTAEILSRSLQQSLPLIQGWDEILTAAPNKNFSDLAETDKGRFLQAVYESEPELNGLKANLNLAVLNLNKIHKIGVLWPVYGQISDIKQELNQAALLMDRATVLVKLLPALAGYPETSRFLLILQNNDELRPTGGFIGVYGILESKNGEIVSLMTDDSYHLDMPASLNDWNLEPPAPLKKYLKVEKWYLRDANWSPDWPTSARKITEIYEGVSRAADQPMSDFTGLVAITPDLIADFIALVGPITVKDVTYTPENFQPLLQYNVEIAYKEQNISSWDRKEIINELVAELKQRLLNLPTADLAELLKIIDRNIAAKNLQIYFSNNDWQNFAGNLGASGEVQNTDGDYLLVVDANLGAFKSDAVVKKKINYTLDKNNGVLRAAVKLDYRHEGDFDWRTTRYRSYTRIYAPLGSRLVSFDGLDPTEADFSVIDDETLNKTVFGFFWAIEPGSAREISVNYLLPTALAEKFMSGEHQLLVQRQAGSRIEALQITINDLKRKPVVLSTTLEADRFFSFNKNN